MSNYNEIKTGFSKDYRKGVILKKMNEILLSNYWEHVKWCKDLALSHPKDHPIRVKAEKDLKKLEDERTNS